MHLNIFQSGYFQANVVVPYILTAPYYFIGKITLGQMQQTVGAFSRVRARSTFFITLYTTHRQLQGRASTVSPRSRPRSTRAPRHRRREQADGPRRRPPELRVDDLEVAPARRARAHAGGRRCLPARARRPADRPVRLGQVDPVPGRSRASGRSARVEVHVPEGQSMMLLPQRPYIPIGTLRDGRDVSGRCRAHYDDAAIARCAARPRSSPATRRQARRGAGLGADPVARRAAASRDRARAPGQARLALPRRGNRGARRADRGRDLRSS